MRKRDIFMAVFVVLAGALLLLMPPPVPSDGVVAEERQIIPENNAPDDVPDAPLDFEEPIAIPLVGSLSGPNVCFPNICINVEVAKTPAERSLGLMFREELADGNGMLFVFEEEGIHSFWMKNTLMPLDMVWIGENLEVVHIEHAVPCKTGNCPKYTPRAPTKYVVEANTGFAEKNKVAVGDNVIINYG